jgi:hypothetical protein
MGNLVEMPPCTLTDCKFFAMWLRVEGAKRPTLLIKPNYAMDKNNNISDFVAVLAVCIKCINFEQQDNYEPYVK